MKSPAYFFAATVVALSATVFAFPALYKRVADGAKVFNCFITAIGTGTWTKECEQAVRIDVGIVQKFSAANLAIDFTLGDSTTFSLSIASIIAPLIPVKGLSWPFVDVAQEILVIENGIPVAVFTSPSTAVAVKDGILTCDISKTLVKIIPGQEANFTKGFMSSIISNVEHTVSLRGTANITVNTNGVGLPAKNFKVVGLAYEAPGTIKGCANFPNTPFLKQISLTFDAATGVYTLTSSVNIINPSMLIMTLGNITYQNVDKDGVVFGTSFFPNVQLALGDNPVTMIMTFTSKIVYDALITVGYNFTLRGSESSSPNPTLAEALKAVVSDINIPKLNPTA